MLALVALSSLPVTLAGGLLLLFAVALFVADVKAPTHGVLTLGGVGSLVLGSALLFNSGPGGVGVDPWVIAGAALVSLGFFGFIVRKAAGARSRDALKRSQVLVGSIGETREDLDPEGRIFVAGAIWEAVSSGGNIPRGTPVVVVAQKEARLAVEATGGGDAAAGAAAASGPEASGSPEPAADAPARRRLRQRTG